MVDYDLGPFWISYTPGLGSRFCPRPVNNFDCVVGDSSNLTETGANSSDKIKCYEPEDRCGRGPRRLGSGWGPAGERHLDYMTSPTLSSSVGLECSSCVMLVF
ncbi:hypothetical protein EVAR_28755_1 [Eumeta japonica]|uniref:Uncharacterized protein n=1 Tax=Eumeta variegata TaxID=151549 RepID=A0A4C1YZB4_EUMVA|nr:hypothetical protein EVAR_28755_1 [Eumeta japonica]